MGVKIQDTMTADGKRLEKTLRELGALEVRIGIQEMESDGKGKYDKEKIYAKGGVRDENGKVTASDVSLLDIAVLNELGTENIPSRPFLRNSVDSNADRINDFMDIRKKSILQGESAKSALIKIGAFQKGLIQEQIVEGSFVPNAEATIRKKKSATPLIDTGRMRQSVNFVIQPKGGPV